MVIDVHTHMLSQCWLDRLLEYGGHRYSIAPVPGGQDAIHVEGAPFFTLTPGMFDYELRVRKMDEAGVDLAIVSLTSPNVFFGDEQVSTESARLINDDMAAAQARHPDRIRWFASLPWQFPRAAVAELDRACRAGAVGVMVLGNIDGESLTAGRFAGVWAEIDRRELPVLLHPASPPGVEAMDMRSYNLVGSIGFAFDTTLAVGRMILDGFFDRYARLKLIAAHAGGALPYLAGRLDKWHESFEGCREAISYPPSEALGRLYFDSIAYRPAALQMLVDLVGADRVLYGSDYPHNVGDMAGCLALVDSLTQPTAAAIRSRNAERIFGLG